MNKIRIYLIEEGAETVRELGDRLARLGCEIAGCATPGPKAREEIRALRPDLLVANIRFADFLADGADQASPCPWPDTPVVFLSAWSDVAQVGRALERGPGSFVMQPCDDRELHLRLQTALSAHRNEQRRWAALREREIRFRAAFDRSSIGIALLTVPEGRIVEVNAAALAAYGYARDEVMGRSSLELGLWADPAERARNLAALSRDGLVSNVTVAMRRKDGGIFTALCNASLVTVDDRTFSLNSFQDITAQKQAETEKSALQQRLYEVQKFEALGTLAGGIAHDFNNILTGILGYVDLARQDLPDGHGARPWLNDVMDAGQRAKDLVRQILAISRKNDAMHLPFSLQAAVADALGLLRSGLPAMVRLEHDIAPACPPVLTDPVQVHQVVMNLCTNALQALPAAGGMIKVELAPCEIDAEQAERLAPLRAGPGVRLTVSDNGSGMDAATLAHIYEPFFTTKKPGAGTGLGLATVYSIVQAHAGGIEVESAPQRGTTFRLYFPAAPEEPAVPAASDWSDLPTGGGRHVLHIDDDPLANRAMQAILQRLDYRLTSFASPTEALARFESNPADFDLVLTDRAMPELSGDRLAVLLLARRPGLPVVMLTGMIDPEERDALLSSGVRDVLIKPPSMDQLAHTLARQVLR